MSGTHQSDHVRLTLPSWLWGGDPRRLLKQSDLRCREEDGTYLVQTEEAYLRRLQPGLVTAHALIGPGVPDRLDELAYKQENVASPEIPDFSALLNERREAAEASHELVAMINHLRLASIGIPQAHLPAQLRAFHAALVGVTLTKEAEVHPFQHAGVSFIQVSSALHFRLKLASVWLRIKHDPLLAAGNLEHLTNSEGQRGHQLFGASADLQSGAYLMDAYLGPLSACLTPAVWCFDVPRTLGTLHITLGQPISGTFGDAVEPLQLVTIPGAREAVAVPDLSPRSPAGATAYWCTMLDSMFGVVSDPVVFADATGNYDPAAQLHAMLSLEQVFRRCSSLMTAHRDLHARRALAFSVLDSIETLTGIDFERLCTLQYATKTLRALEDQLPPAASEVLLPSARRAVSALESLQDGLFMLPQINAQGVSYGDQELAPESAVAKYLKLLRDATHGHGGKGQKVMLTETLLAHHDGHVPHDVGLLGYLYLLDLLSRADRLRRVLKKRAGRTASRE